MMDKPGDAEKTETEMDRDQREANAFFDRLDSVVSWSAIGLVAIYAWLQVPELKSILAKTANSSPDLLWKSGLIIYFLSWVRGSKFDVKLQRDHYKSLGIMRQNQWPATSIAVLAMLIIIAAALAWSEGHIKRFAVVLCVFVLIDHAAWRYLIHRSKGPVNDTMDFRKRNNDFVELEKLKVVINQLHGNWKWWRLSVGLPLTALIVGFAFLEPVRLFVDKAISDFIGISNAQADAVVGGLLVLLFVLAVEIWHWEIRLNTIYSLRILNKLGKSYIFEPKTPSGDRSLVEK